MRKYSFFIFALLSFLSFSFASCEETEAPMGRLKAREPNWKLEVQSYHANGRAKEVVFLEPQPSSESKPVKKVQFNESGTIFSEEDLIEYIVADGEDEKVIYVPHGLGVTFYPSGAKECVISYHKGQLHGPLKSFYPSGKPNHHYCFSEGKYHGEQKSYYESGALNEKGAYEKGIPVGEHTTFYEGGEKASLKNFEKGVLSGTFMEWYKDGSMKSTMLFQEGNLHAKEAPALIHYYENEKVKELQHFCQGQREGLHITYHPNSSRSYQVLYKDGKKTGKEEFFSEEGKLIGEGKYDKGRPVNKHYINYPTGELQRLAEYNAQGELSKPIEEFYLSGQIKARYRLDKEQKFDGCYQEWYEDSTLKLERNFQNGKASGLQKEFYPNGKQKSQAFYTEGGAEQ